MKMKAGSRVMLVSMDILSKVFFSVQAHTPMARMLRPTSWNERENGCKKRYEFFSPNRENGLARAGFRNRRQRYYSGLVL